MADDWQVKGMCSVCETWIYDPLGGADFKHCNEPLYKVITREEDEAKWERRKREEAEEQRQQMEAFLSPIRAHTHKHLPALLRKYAQTSYVDDYGVRQNREWVREIDYFLQNVVHLPDHPVLYDVARQFIHETIVAVRDEHAGDETSSVDRLDPIGFEQRCMEMLTANGWVARRTSATGDQGIDIIATRGILRVVIQCKLYSQPVGNAAVQEAIAGMVFEKADRACVVSNSTYTPAARRLAEAGNVLLLHYEELPRLSELLSA